MAASAMTLDRRAATETFPCFDGLRAIAAVSVAITHSGFISGYNVRSATWGPVLARLDIGVAVFFVISGFLLYRPFVAAALAGRAGPAVRPYARRRFLRIAPAYWVTLTAVLLIPGIQGVDAATPTWDQVVAHYGLFHTYHLSFGLVPVQQAWTLVTELAFYAMLPLYAALLSRVRVAPERRLRVELVGVATLAAIGLAVRTLLVYGVGDDAWRSIMNLWLPARLDHFALGMLLAIASAQFLERDREPAWARAAWLPWASWLGAAAAFWYLTFGFGLDDIRGPANFSQGQEWLLYTMWGVVGLALVAPAVLGPQDVGIIRAVLRLRPLAWLGTISYGIYLWHEAALDLYLRVTEKPAFGLPFARTTLFMFAFTIPVAALSYYLVERPALSLKSRPVRQWLGHGRGAPA